MKAALGLAALVLSWPGAAQGEHERHAPPWRTHTGAGLWLATLPGHAGVQGALLEHGRRLGGWGIAGEAGLAVGFRGDAPPRGTALARAAVSARRALWTWEATGMTFWLTAGIGARWLDQRPGASAWGPDAHLGLRVEMSPIGVLPSVELRMLTGSSAEHRRLCRGPCGSPPAEGDVGVMLSVTYGWGSP